VLAAACSGKPAPEFRKLPGLNNYAMIVPTDVAADDLPAIAKEHCGSASHCDVFAWADEAAAARALPMTDREMEALRFHYAVNRDTGFEQLLWNCKVYPRHNSEECLG
jgi:hypothetical protein